MSSFDSNELAINYLCPCDRYSYLSNEKVSIKFKRKFYQCTNCLYSWASLFPIPLDKCLSCHSPFHELTVIPKNCSRFTCALCKGAVPQTAIIEHYQQLIALYLFKDQDPLTRINRTNSESCQKHNFIYRFLDGRFMYSCSICEESTIVSDQEEIVTHANDFLNCCDNSRIGLSAFRYLDYVIIQCNTCLTETVVTKTDTILKWLSSDQWGVGFVEQQVLSIYDLHVGDHLAYIRTLYEHHVIVVSVDFREGKYKQIGFSQPLKKGGSEAKYTLEGKIELSKKIFKKVDNPMVVIHYLPLDSYTVGHVIQSAFSRLLETDYNVITNNCEHISTWCKYGRYECIQVRKVIDKYSKLGQNLVVTHVVTPVKLMYNQVERAANEDPTFSQIHAVVSSHQINIKERLQNTLNYIFGGTPVSLEEEPNNEKDKEGN